MKLTLFAGLLAVSAIFSVNGFTIHNQTDEIVVLTGAAGEDGVMCVPINDFLFIKLNPGQAFKSPVEFKDVRSITAMPQELGGFQKIAIPDGHDDYFITLSYVQDQQGIEVLVLAVRDDNACLGYETYVPKRGWGCCIF